MSISYGNWDVRIYAAEAWVSLAPRFACEHPLIVDRLEMLLRDPSPAVRVQVAGNLRVITEAAPVRMWAMGLQLAANETDARVLSSYLIGSLRSFAMSEPQRCEEILGVVRSRIDDGLDPAQDGSELSQSIGNLTAQLALQGRQLPLNWLRLWIAEHTRYEEMLNAFVAYAGPALFFRYLHRDEPDACAMSDRAQEAFELVLASIQPASHEARRMLASDISETERQATATRYQSAERIIIGAMNQLYFGSGAQRSELDSAEDDQGLPSDAAKRQFLADYSEVLSAIAQSHEPMALHHLVQLYKFLIPAHPVAVFEAIHRVLLGRGNEESYQSESLANTVVVDIVQRYIAEHRAIFEDAELRSKLVEILTLFSGSGWPEALGLLYDLPELLR